MVSGPDTQRWHVGTLGQYTGMVQLWWDGTLQNSVNKEAKWTLERASLLPLLKLTPPFVTVADHPGFSPPSWNLVAVYTTGFGNKVPGLKFWSNRSWPCDLGQVLKLLRTWLILSSVKQRNK